jgi:ABC-type multidrug transport system fused ATPase/permease subunit
VSYKFRRLSTETALGRKTGQSRCLIDAAEREWSMTLPDPVPLSLLEGCSCLQLRNATIGFPVGGAGPEKGSGQASPVPTAAAVPASGVKTTPVVSSSLGSKKVRAVASGATVTAKIPECTMILENVTLDAHQKSKIAILGKNGCGKR